MSASIPAPAQCAPQVAASRGPDLSAFRADFPILRRQVRGRPLVYLDSAATALKPQVVIEAVTGFYTQCTANVHRAVHALSEEATEQFEQARESVARFINAESREVAFVRHATEALNIVAGSFLNRGLVAISIAEHHSNWLPWQNHDVVFLKVLPTGQIDLGQAQEVIRKHQPALLSLSTISNAFGVRQPVAELTAMARQQGTMVLLDVSQSIGHEPLDVQELGCDYLCFSGHKMLGPSGVGVLYQREGAGTPLRSLLLGGSMVEEVHEGGYVALPAPRVLEAGTPNIEGVLGLSAACDYLQTAGLENIRTHGEHLIATARAGLEQVAGVRLRGTGDPSPILSFDVKHMEASGVARMLSNRFAIMARSGYHCAQPLHEACGLPESVRISVHLYNTLEEIELFVEAVEMLARMS